MSLLLFISSVSLFCSALVGCRYIARELLPLQHPQQKTLQVVGAVAVTFSSLAAFVVLLPGVQPILAAALALGLCSGLFHPAPALSFYVALLFVRPWELVPDNALLLSLPKFGAALCIASWFFHGLLRRNLRLYLNPWLGVYFVFLIWLFVAAAAAGQAERGGYYLFERLFPATVILFLAIHVFQKRTEIDLAVQSMVVAVLGVAATGVAFTYLGFAPKVEVVRLQSVGLLGNSNDLASLVVLALPFVFFPGPPRGLIRLAVILVLSGALLASISLTQSRGALLSCAVMAVSYVLFMRERLSWQKLSLAGGLLAVCAVLFAGIFRDAEELSMSSTSRWNYVLAGIGMIKSSPLFGVGPGRYPEMYELFTPEFVEWGQRTAHSSWVLVMSEAGLPGLFLFCLLWFGVGSLLWKRRTSLQPFCLSFVGYTVAMSFLSHTYLFMTYLLIGLVLARLRIDSQEEDSSQIHKRVPVKEAFEQERASRVVSRIPLNGFAVLLLLLFSSLSPGEVQAENSVIRASAGLEKPSPGIEPPLSESIALSGARGEVVSFLMKLDQGKRCGALAIQSPSFLPVKLYQILPFVTRYPSYTGAPVGKHFDPLLPLRSETICQRAGEPQWLLGEAAIDSGARAGNHEIQITFGDRSNSLNLSVRVFNFEIGSEPTVPFYTELAPYWNLIGHFGKWENYEAELALQYRKILEEHRLQTLTTFIASPAVEFRGETPYADFFRKPTPDQSFSAVNVQGRPSWSYLGFPTVPNEKAYAPETVSYFRGLENSLSELPNHPKRLVYLWDEPAKEMFPALKHLAAVAKKAAPSLKVLVTTNYSPDLFPLVDIFVPVMDFADQEGFPGPEVYRREVQDKGKEFWWYVSCMSHGCERLSDSGIPDLVIDRPSVHARVIGWLTYLNGVDAFLYYSVNHGYQYYPKRDPLKDLWDFSGNGDGTLLYPGRTGEYGLTRHQPLPSIRLKLLRESSYDVEYLSRISLLPTETQAKLRRELQALLPSPRKWKRSYGEYQSFRNRVGELLDIHYQVKRST